MQEIYGCDMKTRVLGQECKTDHGMGYHRTALRRLGSKQCTFMAKVQVSGLNLGVL